MNVKNQMPKDASEISFGIFCSLLVLSPTEKNQIFSSFMTTQNSSLIAEMVSTFEVGSILFLYNNLFLNNYQDKKNNCENIRFLSVDDNINREKI